VVRSQTYSGIVFDKYLDHKVTMAVAALYRLEKPCLTDAKRDGKVNVEAPTRTRRNSDTPLLIRDVATKLGHEGVKSTTGPGKGRSGLHIAHKIVAVAPRIEVSLRLRCARRTIDVDQ
jgi:hypothetical protein